MSEPIAETGATNLHPPAAGWILRAVGIGLARARFLLLVGIFLGVLAAWPYAVNLYEKLAHAPPAGSPTSPDTEYWCPMCPGVVSHWPSKCPVCSMTLIRREKGEMTPLPDGVLARVQLSPYRIHLAGIRTAPVEYRRLEYEAAAAGLLEPLSATSLMLVGEVFERNAVMLEAGQVGRVSCNAFPGETVNGRVIEVAPGAIPAAGWKVRVRVENPHGNLRPGLYAEARFHAAVSRLGAARRVEFERWREQLTGEVFSGPGNLGTASSLIEAGWRQALAHGGLVLAVPESAVIDTGERKAVYVELMPGMFDAVEVRLGRRCGDYYPVWSGLESGQRVATAGAILLDAETRLNPSIAASYFGADQRSTPSQQLPSTQPTVAPPPSSLSDPQLIARQKICPVTGQDLEAMGGPVRLVVDGRVVFICCKGCEKPFRDPKKASLYLQKLPR